jgi:hypothetical protein
VNVSADDVGGGVIDLAFAVPAGHTALDTSHIARAIPVAPVKDHPVVDDDWLAQPVRLDVGNERVELLALHQGEDVSERMKLEAIAAVGCRGYIRHIRSSFFARYALQLGPAFSLPGAGSVG